MSNFSDVIIKWTICDDEQTPEIMRRLCEYFQSLFRSDWIHLLDQYMVVAKINHFHVFGGYLADDLPWFDEESLYTKLSALNWHDRSQVIILSMDEDADRFTQWTLAELDALKAETELKRAQGEGEG